MTLALAMSVGATVATAQVATEEREQASQKQQEKQQPKLVVQEEVFVVTVQDLPLSEQQEARINEIRKEYRPKVEQSAKELKTLVTDEVDQIRNALTPEQRAKIRTMLEQREQFKVESLAQTIANLKELDLSEDELAKIQKIHSEFRPKMATPIKQLKGLLTDEQKEARKEAIEAGKSRREILASLNLTSDQKEQLESVGKQLKDLVTEEAAKIRDVLTAEQRQKLQDFREEREEMVRDRLAHQIANLQDLNLSDQQKTTLMNIRQEFRPKIQEAGDKLRATIGDEVQKIVIALDPERARLAERPQRTE
jgi:Spy/CpxP family protein refolding chaperone